MTDKLVGQQKKTGDCTVKWRDIQQGSVSCCCGPARGGAVIQADIVFRRCFIPVLREAV